MRLDLDGLTVEPLREEHLPAFVAYRRDPVVARYQSWDVDYSLDDARALWAEQKGLEEPRAGGWLQYAIVDPGGVLLGDVAMHRLDDQPDTYELGVTVAPAAQGSGVATRALRGTIDFLVWERGAHRILAHCDARNTAMRAVLERLGLRHEGTAFEADWFKGEWTSLETWAVLGREWTA